MPVIRTGPIRTDLPEREWVWGIVIGYVSKAYPLARLPDGVPIRDTLNEVELELTVDQAALSVKVIVVETGEPLNNGVNSFWFSWQDFQPETLVYAP